MAPLSATAVPMPEPLVHYWTMWNEPDTGSVRQHLDKAVSVDVEWADPQHRFTGRDALEENVIALRTSKPQYRFVIVSEVDNHHNRFRYRWHMMRRHRVLLRGTDIVTIDDNQLICRVDGFFGETVALQGERSGVPDHLKDAPAAAPNR